jgi:predicted membrane chloride channel (bestrophin family)
MQIRRSRRWRYLLAYAEASLVTIFLHSHTFGAQAFCGAGRRANLDRLKSCPRRHWRVEPLQSSGSADNDVMGSPLRFSTFANTTEPDEPFLHTSDPNDHRYSASDWRQNMLSLPRSTILREIKRPVLTVILWSTFVSILHRWFLSVGWTGRAARMCIDSKPHSFLVSALGMLLVFRTNSAYQRFVEGRIIWERILSISRTTSRTVVLYEKEFGAARCRRFFRLLAAFPHLLHHHIQPTHDPSLAKDVNGLAVVRTEPVPRGVRYGMARGFRNDKEDRGRMPLHQSDDVCWVDRRKLPWNLLPAGALKLCTRSSNRPLWVCDRLSQEVNEIVYTPNFTSRERSTLLSQIEKLSKCIGECERIHQTSVPLNYARHSLRSLTLWLFSLPFALIRDFGLLTGPVMGLAAWLFYGIYQIGYTIEDPFQGSLRLSTLCDAIFRDVMMGTDVMKRRMTAFSATE